MSPSVPDRLRRRLLGGVAASAALAACGSGGDESGPTSGDGDAASPSAEGEPTVSRHDYGDHLDAFGDLWTPPFDLDGTFPVLVLIHGGFWRDGFFLDLMDPVAASAAAADRGFQVWNIEYRRVGAGGGWPETFLDVAAAIDHLPEIVDQTDRVAVIGHSAGGHLARWAASRHLLPAGAPGADPVVRPLVAVSQAGVLDLDRCATDGLGGGACVDLVGGSPEEVPDRYDVASPMRLLPTDVPTIAVHGTADTIVPVAQSERYVDAATTAGDDADLWTFDGADHFDVIDPAHESWTATLDRLARTLRER